MASLTLSFLTSSAQPSPEQGFYQVIQNLCQTCELALVVACGVGFLLVVTLLFLGARATATRGHS